MNILNEPVLYAAKKKKCGKNGCTYTCYYKVVG